MSLLLSVINNPSQLNLCSTKDWELLIRQARASQLLAYLAQFIVDSEIKITPPENAQNHMNAALLFTKKQKKNVLLECQTITNILREINVQTIFLKGAAYSISNLNLSNSRLLSDIDVLVKKDDIEKSELALFQQGWFSEEITDYDEQYYRQWAHEIPPLKHIKRGTILDLHHNILQIMTGHIVDSDKLFAQAINPPSVESAYVLSPEIMVMHSAVHLFHESEFNKGLRDLIDIKTLIKHFSIEDRNFMTKLVNTAKDFGFEREIYYALKYSDKILHSNYLLSIDKSIVFNLNGKLDSKILDFCFGHIFNSYHRSCYSWKMIIAEKVLFCRGHLKRMPLKLLLPHTFRKTWSKLIKNTNNQV